MAQTIQPAELASTINQLLDEYQEDVDEVVTKSITEVAKDAAKTLKSAGSFGGTGKFKKSWSVKIEKKRIYTEATVYNKKPGLTHLLEFGHAKQNGGRTKAFDFIAPVNEKVQTEVVRKIEEKLNDG